MTNVIKKHNQHISHKNISALHVLMKNRLLLTKIYRRANVLRLDFVFSHYINISYF